MILFILSLSFFMHVYMFIFVKKPCLKCYKHMHAMLQIVVLENYINFLLLVLFFPSLLASCDREKCLTGSGDKIGLTRLV